MSAKVKIAAPAILAIGTAVTFTGYSEAVDKPVLKEGEDVFIVAHNPEEGTYDVARKAGKKGIDSLLPNEFTVVQADGACTVIVEEGDAVPEVKAKGKGKQATLTLSKAEKAALAKQAKADAAAEAKQAKADALAAKKTAAAEKAAAAAEKKAAAEAAKAPERTAPVKVTASLKELVKTFGNELKAVESLTENVDNTYFKIGGLLAVIQEKDIASTVLDKEGNHVYGTGQKGFSAYVEAKLGMRYRKAQYLIQIYTGVTDAGISETKIAAIGWSKLKEALALLTKENADEILGLAKSQNYDEFKSEMKKRLLASGKTLHGHTNTEEYYAIKTSIHKDQGEVFAQAMTKAAALLGVTDPSEDASTLGQCLYHVVSEWYSMQD